MENGSVDTISGAFSASLSVFSTVFAVVTLKDAQAAVTFTASIIAIVSGCFAIRHYYHATKKLKEK